MLRCLGVCDYHLQDPDSQRLEMGAEIHRALHDLAV